MIYNIYNYRYNMFRGYPLEYGRDPGYTHRLFETVYGDVEYFRQVRPISYSPFLYLVLSSYFLIPIPIL